MIKKILMMCGILLAPSAFADEAEDKAEFKRLYAEFKGYESTNTSIEVKFDVANDLFKFAQRKYGKKSSEYVEAMRILAKVYDEKGGFVKNSDEKKAQNYYERYFKLADDLNIPKDETYINTKVAHIKTLYSTMGRRTDFQTVQDLIDLTEQINLSPQKIGAIEIELAEKGIYTIGKNNGRLLLSSAMNRYKNS